MLRNTHINLILKQKLRQTPLYRANYKTSSEISTMENIESHEPMVPGMTNGEATTNGMSLGEMADDQISSFDMNAVSSQGNIPTAVPMSSSAPDIPMENVLVEMRAPKGQGANLFYMAGSFRVPSFQIDYDYEPVSMDPETPELAMQLQASDEEVIVVKGKVAQNQIAALEAQPNVIKVWPDTPIEPFSTTTLQQEYPMVEPMAGFGSCPIGSCDCNPGAAKGTMADVAKYLGVDKIHAAGYKGQGIVVGVVDGGITAAGRPVRPGEPSKRIRNVIGGYHRSVEWGTQARSWGEHGNMCATDVLGMAPEAKLYDFPLVGNAISNALAAFNWAIKQHKTDGTPHILTNSWGIYQEQWDKTYARNPNHPFTRKVVEAINQGILVLFAAGNCGGTCPDGRCASDFGPGKSIWGANGHPLVMTVGAVNKNEQFVGYSSQGPAALSPQKPDFCSITHFRGYFPCDNGTSAATPIAAGVVALLKQAKPSLTQQEVKKLLESTAKNIGSQGWDQHSGTGIIQPKVAFDKIKTPPPRPRPRPSDGTWSDWENLGGYGIYSPAAASWGPNRIDTFVIGTDHAMYHKWWDGSAWRGWENLEGYIISTPAAVSWGANRIDTFVVGSNNSLYRKWWDGSAWRGWENLGGYCLYAPAASSWGPNRIDTFIIGTDHALYHKWWDGSAWRGWENLGGYSISAPAAVSWGPNHIATFTIGRDRALYYKTWNGSIWTPWEKLGGYCQYGIAAVSRGVNQLDCFVIGSMGKVYCRSWDGSAWKNWKNLGGYSIAGLAAASWGPDRLDVFVVAGDHALHHKWMG
ncbi:S8 family serine peptidase [Moorena sp. SIO3A5]|uniref:S8 family serine peptidase n=1 Tax=Moorena sp. SIO3A5 TaxID=2607822 RepID=UPI0025805E46|nr:S8 family serine peptidase [Moorena sp. SIO3A5]